MTLKVLSQDEVDALIGALAGDQKAAELNRLYEENENLEARAEFIREQYDDCRKHAARLEAENAKYRAIAAGGFWRRVKYLLTGR